jgi:hypothetical protein
LTDHHQFPRFQLDDDPGLVHFEALTGVEGATDAERQRSRIGLNTGLSAGGYLAPTAVGAGGLDAQDLGGLGHTAEGQ